MLKTNSPKIVLVGGGSYSWAPRLLNDIMRMAALENSEIILLDPDLKASQEVMAACKTMAKTLGKNPKFHVTRNQASAFRDADFVIITISTGGFKRMAHDLSIPEKYSIYQTVGDTVGPGGWLRSLCNIPVFTDLAKQIEKYSPKAVVLNYSNPLAQITSAVSKTSSLRNVGLCHGIYLNYRLLQKVFNVEEKDISIQFGGVNHFFWVTDFRIKAKPGYPMLQKKLKGTTLDKLLKKAEADEIGFKSYTAFSEELYRQYGYLPLIADRHTCEFLPGCLRPDVLKKFKIARTSIKERSYRRKVFRKETLDLASGKLPVPEKSREAAAGIINAIVLNKPYFDVVNLPNTGQIDNIPRGVIVETMGITDALGVRALTAGPLPKPVLPLVLRHCYVQEMTVEAALNNNKEQALQALMLDPACSHLAPSRIRAMGLELMKAVKIWLPNFK